MSRARQPRAWRSGQCLAAVGSALVLVLPLATRAADRPERAGEPQPGAGRAVSGADLERLRSEIREARERVGEHEREERALLEVLEEVDRNLEQLSRDVAQAAEKSKEAHAALDVAKALQAGANERLEATQRALARRAVALYKAGEVGPVQVLFTAGSAQELLGRVAMLEALVAHDAELVGRFRRETTAADEAGEVARQASRASDEAARGAAARGAALSRERANKRQLLARVRNDRAQARGLLVELEQAARALEETLAALGGEVRPAEIDDRLLGGGSFEAQRGLLPAPVDARVARPFGRVVDAEYLTETYRKGVEFDARAGMAVRSVAFGEVRFAGWFRGYGKIVILDHGSQYFTVSGHLDRVDVALGQVVGGGDVLGTVGDTGSLSGASLYFEIRQGRQPLDPAEWLR